jgi:hypothetical protein
MLNPIASDVVTRLSNVSVKKRKTSFMKDKRVSGFVTVDNFMIMMKAAEKQHNAAQPGVRTCT